MKLDNYKGPLAMLTASFIYVITYLSTKFASKEISGEEIAFTRFFIGIIITYFMVFLGKATIITDKKGLLIARGTFGGLAIIFLFMALATGPVTNAVVLNNTYPIFATILAAFYLKEKMGWSSVAPLVFAFFGIVLLIHPDLSGIRISDLYGILSGICGGISVNIIRELRKTQNSWTVFFYLGVFGALFSAILALPKWVWPSAEGWFYMLVSGVSAAAGQLIATWGYKYCSTSTGSTVSMTSVLFSALAGMVFLGEKLKGTEIIGVILLLVSSTYLVGVKKESNVKERSVNG